MKRKNINTFILENNVNNRKHTAHFTKRLKSGKTAHLWFYRYRVNTLLGLNYKNTYWWGTAMHVGKTNKEARLWFAGKHGNNVVKTTGDGTLEALVWALRTVEAFRESLPEDNIVTIGWADRRRFNAYHYLKERRGWFCDLERQCFWKEGGKQCTT